MKQPFVRLPDNKIEIIILKPIINNIPGVTVDCLFSGKLVNDASSVITVSGCMNSAETTLSIASSLVCNGVVDLVLANGTTTVLKDDEATVRALDPNDELEPPQGVVTPAPTQFSGSLPQAVDLTTTLWYDQSLLRKFSNNHVTTKQWLARVVAFATIRFADPSLNVRINLKTDIESNCCPHL